MDKDWLWSLVGIGWAAFTVSGAGPKWVRRFAWPVVIAGLALFYNVAWLRSLACCGLLICFHSLGYSPQRKSVVQRMVIGFSFGFALVPLLGWAALWAGLSTTLVFNLGMAASLRWNWVGHKWSVEGPTGAVQGAWVAWGLLR